jgi:hypothetical protein
LLIGKQDPHELLGEFEATLSEEYPFWRHSSGRAGDALQRLGYLQDGLREIDELLEKLERRGKLKWAITLLDSVSELKAEIDEFLQNADEDQEEFHLQWKIETKRESPKLRLVHGKKQDSDNTIIRTHHKRTVESYKYRSKQTRPVTTKDVMITIYASLRKHFDSLVA